MRTTVTLDPDVARMIKEAMHCQRRAFKDVVNDALRRALSPGREPPTIDRYQVEPHVAVLNRGLDPRALNRLADELEDQAIFTPEPG